MIWLYGSQLFSLPNELFWKYLSEDWFLLTLWLILLNPAGVWYRSRLVNTL